MAESAKDLILHFGGTILEEYQDVYLVNYSNKGDLWYDVI